MITKEDILQKSQGGRLIIEQLLPQSRSSFSDSRKKFKIREERTPSASVSESKGVYYVTDFGADGKARNAIDLLMLQEEIDFKVALIKAAEMLEILQPTRNRDAGSPAEPRYKRLDISVPEKIGDYSYQTKEWDCDSLRYIGRFADSEACEKYQLLNLESYDFVARDKSTGHPVKHRFSATKKYPIFFLKRTKEDGSEWGKILQPKAEKQYRFMYKGNKPPNYLFGLDELYAEFDRQSENDQDFRLPKVILCAGDRDAINVASTLQAPVIWLNSETADFQKSWVDEIKKMVSCIYFIPDLDQTGQDVAHRLNMRYLNWYQIDLPYWLHKKKDARGCPCKDVTDYLQLCGIDQLQQLVDVAKPYRFWDQTSKRNAVNNARLYRFLQKNGFYQMKRENTRDDYEFVWVNSRILKRVGIIEIKSYINRFLDHRKLSESVRNLFYTSNHGTTPGSLQNLAIKDFPIYRGNRDAMHLFFENATVEITADGAQAVDRAQVPGYIWEQMVLNHPIKLAEQPPFTITSHPAEFEVDTSGSPFLQFLRNTSNPYWDQSDLSEVEQQEVNHYLMNKLYALGYLLHHFKDPLKPLVPVIFDLKIARDGAVNGGTGKSIFMGLLKHLTKTIYKEGRKLNPGYEHVWDGVDSSTNVIAIDDAEKNFPFKKLYTAISGDLNVNPKGKEPYSIPFSNSPKFCITTNHPISLEDGSTKRRVLPVPFSDYYHTASEEYQCAHTPELDFGKALPDGFTKEEWNTFYNLIIYSIQFYLAAPHPIHPPEMATKKRILTEKLGADFIEWADDYFLHRSDRLNCKLVRKEVAEAFDEYNPILAKKMKPQTFKSRIKDWCNLKGLIFNPPSKVGKDGRIVERAKGQVREMFFIQSTSQNKIMNDD